jgi:hypothetical protein
MRHELLSWFPGRPLQPAAWHLPGVPGAATLRKAWVYRFFFPKSSVRCQTGGPFRLGARPLSLPKSRGDLKDGYLPEMRQHIS